MDQISNKYEKDFIIKVGVVAELFVHCRLQSKRCVCSFVSKLDYDVLVVTVLYTRLYFVKSY